MKENKVGIITILEHKVKEHLASRVTQKLAPGWRYATNYEYTDEGRIWLLWDPAFMTARLSISLRNSFKVK